MDPTCFDDICLFVDINSEVFWGKNTPCLQSLLYLLNYPASVTFTSCQPWILDTLALHCPLTFSCKHTRTSPTSNISRTSVNIKLIRSCQFPIRLHLCQTGLNTLSPQSTSPKPSRLSAQICILSPTYDICPPRTVFVPHVRYSHVCRGQWGGVG